ncbi:MAG TPA: hypothetical protein VJM46_04725, partial [Candidatus Saccharimonadales bacterium]|nr:hypothetical protein [Candidatus Saccharimonadales bacterium]
AGGRRYVVIDPAPRHLIRSAWGDHYQLGSYGLLGVDIDHFTETRPSKTTKLDEGHAFSPYALGLIPDGAGNWADYCLVRPGDM